MTRSPKAQETAEAKGRKLSKFLCFAVYSANLAFGRAYKPILDAVGLTYTQYIAMVALSEADEQTVSELGEKLFLESNTLTPILKKLEQTGYISRVRDPADERQVRVSLTAAGRRLLENELGGALVEACGLGDEFSVVQKNVVRLRDNLLRNTRPSRASSASTGSRRSPAASSASTGSARPPRTRSGRSTSLPCGR